MKYFLYLSFLIFFAALTSIDVSANGDLHEDVICDEGFQLIFKPTTGIPICAKSSNVESLIERGYTLSLQTSENLRIGLLFSTTGDYSK